MITWLSTSTLTKSDLDLFEKFFADENDKDRKFANVDEISETDLRNALLVEAKRRKVWGAKAINKMTFETVEHSCCYHVSFNWFISLIFCFRKFVFKLISISSTFLKALRKLGARPTGLKLTRLDNTSKTMEIL